MHFFHMYDIFTPKYIQRFFMKKDKIYKQIKQDILTGKLKEGDKLPTEFECMEIYHVSRDTVRGAFKLLENEGFIKRVKSKGTFICLPENTGDSKNIYLLVSCYEHLHYASQHSLQIMFDLIAECALAGWNLVPVIFSQTNSPTDIWWENLSRFNAQSKVVIPQLWFANYFKTLSELRAKVALINNDAEIPAELIKYTRSWSHFIEKDSFAGEDAVNYLARRNCRKIALIMDYLENPSNSLRIGYEKALKEHALPCCIMPSQGDVQIEKIKEFYHQENFDGLIVHINEYNLPHNCSFREALGLPQDMPIVTIPCKTSSIYRDRHENIAVVEYQIRQMCRDIVSYLTSSDSQAEYHFYNTSLQ